MKKLFLISLVLILATGLILASCGEAEPEEEPRAGPYGTIRVAMTDFGTETVDPVIWGVGWSLLIFDNLLTFDENGDYVGNIAQTWDLSADGRTWTFHIRKDVKFHNGDPLTAHDVHFEIERFITPESKSAWATQLRDQFVSHRVVDEFTYEFVTKDPQPQLVDTFCWVAILPKKYIEEVGIDYFREHPIGSGPWKFVEHVPETSFKVEANTEYWNPDLVPYFQYWEEIQVPEEATQVAMFKRGEIDLPFGLTIDRLVDLRDEGYQTRSVGIPPSTVLAIIGSHLAGSGPVHDIRVRKALSYAINRQEMCDTLYRELAVPGGRFFLTPGAYGVTDDLLAPDPYDPDMAKQLLAEAGYPDKWADPTINCFLSAGPGMDMWQALQGYWEKVGLQVKINILDVSEVWQYVFLNELKGDEKCLGWIWSWTGGAFNGTAYCRNMYTSYGIHQVTVDEHVTALFDKYIVELDLEKAKQYYIDWQRAARDLYTSIGIVYQEPLTVVSDKIGEITINKHKNWWEAACGITHPEE